MPAVTSQRETLVGELLAFRGHGSSGWGFGSVSTERGVVAIVGTLLGVRVGDTIEADGNWTEHPKFGRQFKVSACTSVQPQNEDGVVAWLSSTLPDVGEGRARELVARFGKQLWEVIERDHRQLTTVPGITPARADQIREAYFAHRADRDSMVTLRGWGLTDNQIGRCVKQWKTPANVVEHIRENPYQLSEHVHGFGFLRADVVATKAGVKFDSPARVAAGVAHVLGESRSDGHCFVVAGELARKAVALLGVDRELVIVALRAAVNGDRSIIRRGARIYSRRIDRAEKACARAIVEMLRGVA